MYRVEIPRDGLDRKRLPAICPITGETEKLVYQNVTFSWASRWASGFMFGGLLFAMLMESLTNKTAKGEMPFRRYAWWRWKLAPPLMFFAVVASVVEVGIALEALGDGALAWVIILAAVVFGVPFVIWWKMIRFRTIVVEEINDDVIVLRIPSERAAMALGGKIVGAALKLSPAAAHALQEAALKTDYAPERTPCAYHPDTRATWCCGRCGSFFCPLCAEHPTRAGKPVCVKCFAG